MDKSFVSLETAHCPICGEEKDTGTILMDKRIKDSLERKTCTGIAICMECQTYIDDGYVALVGVSEKESVITDNRIRPEGAHRLAEYLWLKKDAAKQMFNVDIAEHPFVYIDQETIDKIKEIIENASE